MADVLVGDIRLNVFATGQGIPLLFVHGFPFDHRMWQRQLNEFVRTHRVIAPDLRGFGKSHVTHNIVTMEQFADDLDGLLDALNVTERVVLCGLSMGGYIAWQFVNKYPERLRGLVLCDTRAVPDTAEAAQGRRETAAEVLKDGPAKLVQSMLPKLLSTQACEEQPALEGEVRQIMLEQSPHGIAAALAGMADRPDARDGLAKIDVPTLVLVGEDDQISPADEMQQVASAIPNARFEVIPCAGHLAPLENPEAVNAALRGLLGELA